MANGKPLMIGVPGLGGHESSLAEYVPLFPSYDLRIVRLVDHERALQEILALCEKEAEVIFLCNCYGLQLALRAAEKMPEKVNGIIVIEAFFAQFHRWAPLARGINRGFIRTVRGLNKLGLRRTRFWSGIDYAKLARYPIYFQPAFDMLWQDLGNYFSKIDDILSFKLPAHVSTPTLIIASPGGYLRSARNRRRLRHVFGNLRILEVEDRTHNIVSTSAKEIVTLSNDWLQGRLPSVSVVIPTLNEERCIGTLLDCIASQDYKGPLEVVVADKDSTDRTREIAMSYQNTFPIKIVAGGMPAVARNNGAKASGGDILFFLDADLVLPDKTFISRTVDYFMEKNLAAGSTPLVPKSDRKLDHRLVKSYNKIMHIAKYIRPLGAMCIVASRKTFDQTGGYPEDVVMAEDHDFVHRCNQLGRYDILPEPVIFSVRRLEKEGRWGLTWKYIYATMYRLAMGPITQPIFSYEFSYTDAEHV
jgi:GT2 family glycosyltransferase/pimeloyl-ACP methyl ester carboxylesterase